MRARCVQNLSVSVLSDGTLVFNRRVVEKCGLQEGDKVSLLFDEARKRLVIVQVPEWMGGIRLTVQSPGMLTAEKGLDFLFDVFQNSPYTRTYDARWDNERGLIVMRMPLRRNRNETVEGKVNEH